MSHLWICSVARAASWHLNVANHKYISHVSNTSSTNRSYDLTLWEVKPKIVENVDFQVVKSKIVKIAVYVCKYVYIYVYIYIYLCIYVYIYVYIYTCI